MNVFVLTSLEQIPVTVVEKITAALGQAVVIPINTCTAALDALATKRASFLFWLIDDCGPSDWTSISQITRRFPSLPIIGFLPEGKQTMRIDALRAGAQEVIDVSGAVATLSEALAHAQARVLTADEQRRGNLALKAFGSAVRHDLSAPPRQIEFLADVMLEDYGDDIPGNALSELGMIKSRSADMGNLISSVKTLVQLFNQRPEKQPCKISELVASGMGSQDANCGDRVVQISDDHVVVDKQLGGILFANLLQNALMYWRETPSRVVVSTRRNDADVQISITDTGIGMPVGGGDDLFLPGRRGVHRDEFPGVGYGLTICRQIVEAHDGRIWATSVVGEGTTIEILLPAPSSHEVEPETGSN